MARKRNSISSSSVGQTSDRQLHIQIEETPAEVLREQTEILKKKLILLINGDIKEARTSKLEFRTWPDLKYVYGRAPEPIKTAARKAFESVILAWFLGKNQVTHNDNSSPAVFNININVNEAKSEAKAEAKIEIPKNILDSLNDLEKLLDFLSYSPAYPAVIKQRARDGLNALHMLMKRLSN